MVPSLLAVGDGLTEDEVLAMLCECASMHPTPAVRETEDRLLDLLSDLAEIRSL